MCNIMSAWHNSWWGSDLRHYSFLGSWCLLVHVLVLSLCGWQVVLVFTLLHVTTKNRQTVAPNVLSMTMIFLFVFMGLVYPMPSTIMCTYQELPRWRRRPERRVVFRLSFSWNKSWMTTRGLTGLLILTRSRNRDSGSFSSACLHSAV